MSQCYKQNEKISEKTYKVQLTGEETWFLFDAVLKEPSPHKSFYCSDLHVKNSCAFLIRLNDLDFFFNSISFFSQSWHTPGNMWLQVIQLTPVSKRNIHKILQYYSAVNLMSFFQFSLSYLVEENILSNFYLCAFRANMLSFRVMGAQTFIYTCFQDRSKIIITFVTP